MELVRRSNPVEPHLVTFPQQGSDDRDAYVDFGQSVGAFGTTDFTVAHWFLATQNQLGTLADVVGNRTSYGHGNFFCVRMRGDGILSVELDQDDAGTNYSARTVTGQPTFISGADSFRLGRRAPFPFATHFAFYDDLLIFDYALTPTRIQAMYAAG